ncbi:hypothetical protein V8F20_002621 [Naviculisporaceae sp. PSN 640]
MGRTGRGVRKNQPLEIRLPSGNFLKPNYGYSTSTTCELRRIWHFYPMLLEHNCQSNVALPSILASSPLASSSFLDALMPSTRTPSSSITFPRLSGVRDEDNTKAGSGKIRYEVLISDCGRVYYIANICMNAYLFSKCSFCGLLTTWGLGQTESGGLDRLLRARLVTDADPSKAWQDHSALITAPHNSLPKCLISSMSLFPLSLLIQTRHQGANKGGSIRLIQLHRPHTPRSPLPQNPGNTFSRWYPALLPCSFRLVVVVVGV